MSKGRRAPGVEERGGGSVAAHLDSAQAINSLFHPSALLNCSPRSGPCPEGGGCCHQKAIRVVSNADMSCITGNRNKLSAFPLRNNDNSCRKNWQRIFSQNFVSGWVIWFLTMGIDCERVSWGWTTFWTRQSCFLLSKTADDTCFQPWNNHQISFRTKLFILYFHYVNWYNMYCTLESRGHKRKPTFWLEAI